MLQYLNTRICVRMGQRAARRWLGSNLNLEEAADAWKFGDILSEFQEEARLIIYSHSFSRSHWDGRGGEVRVIIFLTKRSFYFRMWITVARGGPHRESFPH